VVRAVSPQILERRYASDRPALPREVIGGTFDFRHQHAVLGSNTARMAADDHRITRVDRLRRNACSSQLRGTLPLDRVALLDTGTVLGQYVEHGMRVAVLELHDLAFDRDGL